MKVKDQSKYNEFQDINLANGLGQIVITFTEKWAEYMENEIENKSKTLEEIAYPSSFEASNMCGIMTGAQVAMAVMILDNHWIYGGNIKALMNVRYSGSIERGF